MSSTVSNPAPLRDHEADPSRATSHAIGFWQGVALIFGTNIGAGILSLPYAARNGGFLALAVALAIAGTLTTISMLYVAEVSLRTKEPLQLSGLAEKYMGQTGRFLVFAAIMVNSIGALIAYASGSGELVHNIFGAPPLAGTLIFYALGAYIMWKGLQATGLAEGLITSGMALIITILVTWTIAGPGIELTNLWVLKPYFIIPIMNLAVFTFLAQYVVPEMARGMAETKPEALPKAIIAGMSITAFTLAAVPFAALGLLGTEVTEVVTIAWGEKLGTTAYYMANLFALLAMFTSFLAIGFTAMRNVLDIFHWPEDGWQRVAATALTVLPPLVIALAGLGGFVSALTYAGGFAGAIMSVVPVLLLRISRKRGDKTPVWQVRGVDHVVVQATIIVVYVAAFIYSVISLLGFVPAGWA